MKASVWLKIEAKKKYGTWAQGHISAFKTKPTTSDNEVAFKIEIEIPDAIFEEPVYEVKLKLPDVTKKFPEISEVKSHLQAELTKKMGFRVKIDMPPEVPLES